MMMVCGVILLRSSEGGWVDYRFFLYRCEQIQMNDESIRSDQIRLNERTKKKVKNYHACHIPTLYVPKSRSRKRKSTRNMCFPQSLHRLFHPLPFPPFSSSTSPRAHQPLHLHLLIIPISQLFFSPSTFPTLFLPHPQHYSRHTPRQRPQCNRHPLPPFILIQHSRPERPQQDS